MFYLAMRVGRVFPCLSENMYTARIGFDTFDDIMESELVESHNKYINTDINVVINVIYRSPNINVFISYTW